MLLCNNPEKRAIFRYLELRFFKLRELVKKMERLYNFLTMLG